MKKAKSEELSRIEIQRTLEDFCRKSNSCELALPPVLTKLDRIYVHKLCSSMGLTSKSHGLKGERHVVVRKRVVFAEDSSTGFKQIIRPMAGNLDLPNKSFEILTNFSQLSPINKAFSRSLSSIFESTSKVNAGARVPDRLNVTPPKIPPEFNHNPLLDQRVYLPIYPYRKKILHAIHDNQVILIVGETGSGKSTQVPQYILENANQNCNKCRILCTEPRRIAAMTVSERCANERGEEIGSTVGYQIRLERNLTPATLLTFCTNGILLRSLIGGHSILMNLTHIIVDEVHERDRMSDFLLTVLRELLPDYPHLKLILMSASLDVDRFQSYFPSSILVDVPGRTYDVQEYFLEDVLQFTNYKISFKNGFQRFGSAAVADESSGGFGSFNESQEYVQVVKEKSSKGLDSSDNLMLSSDIDELLEYTFKRGGLLEFNDLICKIDQGFLKVNSRHSGTHVTPLAILAARGTVQQVERMLDFGIDEETLTMSMSLAASFGRQDVLDAIQKYYTTPPKKEDLDTSEETEAQKLLNSYFGDSDDEQVDSQLVLELIVHILSISAEGAILIFLPGYEAITILRDVIMNDPRMPTGLFICILHSLMMPNDQKEAFRPAQPGWRKIVLSTNIAEVSVTINDVVYVIDSGIMKERLYDACSGVSMLCNVWISKANALQRRGRAGRCQSGVCFRLYSKLRYEHMSDNQVPEMLRVPIHELCLQTKLLFPNIERVEDILSKAPDPPAPLILRSCVELLKTIGAMNTEENLTILGRKLAELPVDPQFAKILLYGVLMRCIEPILIIVACQSYKDPFILPKVREERTAASDARSALGMENFSDHLVLLRAFDGWYEASKSYLDRQFCSQHFLSGACMSMIYGIKEQMRAQLERLGYIRCSTDDNYLKLNENADNWSVIKAVLVAGHYPNIAFVDHHKHKIRTRSENAEISMTSSLAAGKSFKTVSKLVDILPTDWIIYNELVRVRKNVQIKCVTCVSPMSIALFAGPVNMIGSDSVKIVKEHSEMECWDDNAPESFGTFGVLEHSVIQIDGTIVLKTDPAKAKLITNLREHLHTLFFRMLKVPWGTFGELDDACIKTVVEALTLEDERSGLPNADVHMPKSHVRRVPPSARSFYNKNKRK